MNILISISLYILIFPALATETNQCSNDNLTRTIAPVEQLSNSTSKVISELKSNNSINGELNFEKMKILAIQNKDSRTVEIIKNLELFLIKIKNLPDLVKLKKINDYFNGKFKYADDQITWGKVDYWSTPLEFFTQQAGDCEDFAILKYFSLIYAGVPKEKLKISYVRVHNKYSFLKDESHMVLKYFNSAEEDPLILDTQVGDIYPNKKRIDLKSVYDFDLNHIYVENVSLGKSLEKVSNWKNYLERSTLEGSVD